MSYTIRYNSELNKKYPNKRKHKQLNLKYIIILIFVCISAYVSAQKGWLKYLLPGNPDVTSAALSQLIEGIGEGRPVQEAVYGFCEDIITGGLH